MARILLIILCLSTSSWAIRVYNGTTSSKLGTRERNRRLIPYMTFYLAQPVDQSLSQVDPSYVQYSPPPEKDRGWPYPPAQPPPIEQPQYLVAPQQYQTYDNRYLQQPQLNKFAQNYLAIPKQYKKVQQPRPNVYSQDAPHPESYSIALAPFKQNNQGDQLLQEVEEPLQYNVQPQLQQHLQYRPNVVATQLTPNQYKASYDTQYRPEVILQYQTPAPRPLNFQYKRPTFKTQKQHEQQTIKQHLTEITRPVSRPVAYVPQKEDLSGYTVEQKQPSYKTKVDESGYSGGYNEQSYIPTTTVGATEPSVSIMQSQELEVMTEPPQVQTPIATVAPKYRVTVSSAPKYHAVYVAQTTTTPSPVSALQGYKEHYEYDEVGDRNLNNILQGVSLSKTLPDRITPENLDSSIKSLSKLLKILQRANALPQTAKEIVRTFPRPVQPGYSPNIQRIPHKKPSDNDEGGATPGQAGIDYPVYDAIPQTRFSCKTQRYKGFFGDPETRCQVWHYCDLNGGQASFLCPNGTIFSQVALTCDWWFNVKCASTAQLYVLNERLYKYILPKKPSFPEDYAGPLVDTYLTNKFKELEQAKNNKTENASMDDKDLDPLINDKDHQYSLDDVESENKVIRSILGLDT